MTTSVHNPFSEMRGWSIKPRYISGVLIGNWFEERQKYLKLKPPQDSSYHTDYNPYPGALPDVLVRRHSVFTNEGIGKDHLLGHHGKKYCSNLVTWYDQDYNGKKPKKQDALPEQREWKIGTHMAWVPEKSDYPCFGEPTNWGLTDSKLQEWHKDRCEAANLQKPTDYSTTHKIFYGKCPDQTVVNRFYIGKSMNKGKSTVLPLSKDTLKALGQVE